MDRHLGKFESVRGPGLTFIFLPLQTMVRVSLRTVTTQIPSQRIITTSRSTSPRLPTITINQISQTTVRNIVGHFSLDQLLS